MTIEVKTSLAATLFVAGAFSLASAPVAAQQSDSIIVLGTPIEETERALSDCLARGCPPETDIALSIAHAENLFIAGDYKDGEEVLNDSLGRTGKYKRTIPVPLSELHRARGLIAQHLGEPRDFRLATLELRDVLKDAFGKEDQRVLLADIEVGDSRAKLGYANSARSMYEGVEKSALALGNERVASIARLRLALLAKAEIPQRPNGSFFEARYEAALDKLIDEPLADSGDFTMVARVLKARLDRERGREGATEALIKAFAAMGGTEKPVLLYNEPLKTYHRGGFPLDPEIGLLLSNQTERMTSPILNSARFIDVGFWVRPDGSVEDIEVLRAEGPDTLHPPVISSIASRRYAPLDVDAQSPGIFQVERYTFTANLTSQTTGTRIRQREPGYRIQMFDLTPENTEDLVTNEG